MVIKQTYSIVSKQKLNFKRWKFENVTRVETSGNSKMMHFVGVKIIVSIYKKCSRLLSEKMKAIFIKWTEIGNRVFRNKRLLWQMTIDENRERNGWAKMQPHWNISYTKLCRRNRNGLPRQQQVTNTVGRCW